MWKINKKRLVPHSWLEFEPETVLDEYDCPLLFTLRDIPGNKYLAYFCDMDGSGVRFLVVPFTDNLETKLVGGDIDLRGVLIRSPMWVFDLDKKWNPVRAWKVVLADLPKNLIPNPGVMLRPGMQPLTKPVIVQSNTGTASVTRNLVYAGA